MTAPDRRPSRHKTSRRTRGWMRFVETYGWRAYALPVLSVVTIAALVHGTSPSAAQTAQPKHPDHRATVVSSKAGRASTPSSTPSTDSTRSTGPAGVTSIYLPSDSGSVCASNSSGQLILVSRTAQHLWACQGDRQVEEAPVTTGAAAHGDETPLGSWRLQGKQTNRYLVGPGYRDFVKFWMPFNGDFGLHDASWQSMPFGSKTYDQAGSHGCVHVPTKAMAWLYAWSRVGSTVVTIQA